jgi:hypothetical protein
MANNAFKAEKDPLETAKKAEKDRLETTEKNQQTLDELTALINNAKAYPGLTAEEILIVKAKQVKKELKKEKDFVTLRLLQAQSTEADSSLQTLHTRSSHEMQHQTN